MEKQIEKPITIDGIREALLLSSENSKVAISNAIKAQLEVLKFVEHPEMYESTFDTMIEYLDYALQTAEEKEKKDLQRKAAVMINSMIFFLRAKHTFEANKNEAEGERLLLQASDILADSINGFIQNIDSEPTTALIITGIGLANALFLEKKQSGKTFFSRLIGFIYIDNKLAQQEDKLYALIASVIEKMNRNKEIFGQSRLLAEFVLRYKDELVARSVAYPDKQEIFKYNKYSQWGGCILFLTSISIYFISLFIRGGEKTLNYFGADIAGENAWYYQTGDYLWYTLIFAVSAMLVSWIACYTVYQKKLKEYHKEVAQLHTYYSSISESFR
ncbi:MAG: hypothetical protein LIP05_11515 [Tannerellaceae bacterium]|nr:hypothetical protein [Tannerellaceae bacterium]